MATDDTKFKDMVVKNLTLASKILISLATFFTSIGLFFVKIHVKVLKFLAEVILNMSVKVGKLLLLPNRTQTFKYVFQRSPLSHPIVEVTMSDTLKSYIDHLPLYSHLICGNFVLQKIPDYDVWDGTQALIDIPYKLYMGPTAVKFDGIPNNFYQYPINEADWISKLKLAADDLNITMNDPVM